jgi:hypothetical protein
LPTIVPCATPKSFFSEHVESESRSHLKLYTLREQNEWNVCFKIGRDVAFLCQDNFIPCCYRPPHQLVAPLGCAKNSSNKSPLMLKEHDALQIYEFKLSWKTECSKDKTYRSLRGQSNQLSKFFGVSSRTIRDIWNRKSWASATRCLWSREPDRSYQTYDGSIEDDLGHEVRSSL